MNRDVAGLLPRPQIRLLPSARLNYPPLPNVAVLGSSEVARQRSSEFAIGSTFRQREVPYSSTS